MPKAIADREVQCTSCGDTVKSGKPISLQRNSGRTEIFCVRCDPPTMETARVHMQIKPKPKFVSHKRKN